MFNKVRDYFRSIGGDLINICTFGTEGSKSAINTAARGLDIDEEVASYLTVMIPNARGFDWTLKQCYYGDEEHPAIKAFKDEIDKYPMWREVAFAIEGMVTRLGCHASGVLALNESVCAHNSVMKTSKGILVTAYDLEDTEALGGTKYDYLTVQALDKIRTCMNLLLEDNAIEWQGSLRATYDKYVHPDVLNYDDRGMWDALYRREIPSCFQFDSVVGSQAIQLIHPVNLAQLTAGNGLMRLMANEDGDLPLDIYVKHKNDISTWEEEMRHEGLTEAEQELLKKYLNIVYGVAVSQETMMRLSMDPHISNFDMAEANILRKAVAKKKADVLQKGKELFYNKGLAAGTSLTLLDYVWNKQIMLQAGYSFSDIHATAYSYIALQEMNLCYFFPSIYWKCACLSVDAGAVNEEDYYNLVEEGIVELSDEEDKREQSKVQYGKMASALIKAREYGVGIELPEINKARYGFTPDAKRNTILFGIRGISRIGEQIIQEIIINRDYKSLADFIRKMTTADGKKLISKDRIVNLIKAGAFDLVEGRPRAEILKDYILSVADQKQKLNLMNFAMLIQKKLIPDELAFSAKVYNFTKYIRKMKYMGNYILDNNGMRFYAEHYDTTKIKVVDINGTATNVIPITYWDSIYNREMDKPRAYIKAHHDELLSKLNNILFQEEYDKYATGDQLQWELDSLNFYYSGHPLANLQLPCTTTPLKELKENDFDGFWTIRGKMIPKHKLKTIVGTVIDKNKVKGIVTLQCPDGVIDVKIPKQQFARYAHTITDLDDDGNKNVLEDSFFNKGTHLAVTGILRNDIFVPKVYRDTGYDALLRIVLKDDGSFDYFMRKAE